MAESVERLAVSEAAVSIGSIVSLPTDRPLTQSHGGDWLRRSDGLVFNVLRRVFGGL